MEAQMKAIETTGTIDEQNQLHLDSQLPILGPARVKVIVMFMEEQDDISEREWLTFLSRNSVFDFLNDPAEDIYSITDGKPYHDDK